MRQKKEKKIIKCSKFRKKQRSPDNNPVEWFILTKFYESKETLTTIFLVYKKDGKERLFMKKVFLTLASIALIVSSCGGKDMRRDATSVGEQGWVFEGWACAPDTAAAKRGESPADYCKGDSSKFDYLYMKFSAVASEKAIKSGRIAQMQATCRQAAKDQIAGDGLSKVIGDYLEKASGVSDGQSTGQVIVSQTQGNIKGIGVYDCCSLDGNTGLCAKKGEPETWEQCQCVGYMKFPGGQKAFESAAREASR